jgi:hypothetical protein
MGNVQKPPEHPLDPKPAVAPDGEHDMLFKEFSDTVARSQ